MVAVTTWLCESCGKSALRELKTRLGAYLREVREGATLIVTERGVPVADEIRPLPTRAGRQKKSAWTSS